jgi:hypothetical protein
MGVITARGKAAKESANKATSNIDWKNIFIRLKDGESVRVRILGPEDYAEYKAHGNYNSGIFTQPCIEPDGKDCAMCDAAKIAKDNESNKELESFKGLYRKNRYLFAMADIDQGMLRFFDASKGQAKPLIDAIDQYEDSLSEVAFVFKRMGQKTETTYILSPILKLKAPDKEKFAKFDGEMVDEGMFDMVLQPRSREQQIEELAKAGFPVRDYFPDEIDVGIAAEADLPPVEFNEDTIPF